MAAKNAEFNSCSPHRVSHGPHIRPPWAKRKCSKKHRKAWRICFGMAFPDPFENLGHRQQDSLTSAASQKKVKDTPSIVGYNDTIACWPEVSTRSNFRNLQWKCNHPILSWKCHARSPRCFVCINMGSQVLLYFLSHQGLHLRIRDMHKTWDTTRTVQQKHVIFVNR